MKVVINGVHYDTLETFPFDDSCLGRTKDGGYLWQMLLVTKEGNYCMVLAEKPEGEQPYLSNLGKAEVFALTKEQAVERYETRLFTHDPGAFARNQEEDIQEYLNEEDEE